MKTMIRSAFLFLFCLAISMGYAAVPLMSVSVSDSSGKAAFKGATNSAGVFATSKLKPGQYVVQLNSKSPAVKGNQYAIVVSAGTKKVAASAVAGEKFAAGGVALKVDVGPNLNITGQVAEDSKAPLSKSGKKMVWIPPQLGSNLPGRWVEEDSAEAKEARTRPTFKREQIQKIQDTPAWGPRS